MIIMPIQDNVVIKMKKTEKEQKSSSGIIIATKGQGQELQEEGLVIAIGSGRVLFNGERIKPEIKEGDKVIFNKFAGTKISSEDGEFLIIKENDILAIIKS